MIGSRLMFSLRRAVWIAAFAVLAAQVQAQDATPAAEAATRAETAGAVSGEPAAQVVASPDDQVTLAQAVALVGPETNLPLPRFVSLKAGDSNVRRGPSLSHRIDWVFKRRDMPLQIVAEYGHWRRVVDREGLGGWVHYSLLSGTRTVIVDQDMLPLLARPQPGAPQMALLESGVIARLGDCTADWCRLSAGGYRGWAPKTALWGVSAEETRE